MNYHLIYDTTYAVDFISFCNKYFGKENNLFYVLPLHNSIRSNTDFLENNYQMTNDPLEPFKHIKTKKDHIIIHGLFENRVIAYLFLHPELLKNRTSLVMWGGDLYSHRRVISGEAHFKERCFDKLKKDIFQNVHNLCFDMPTDYQLMREWYKIDRSFIQITYPQSINMDLIDKTVEKKKSSKHVSSTTNILIGNSATESNRHLEAIDFIAQYNDQDIHVYCPLSYGDKSYANDVITYGNKIFGHEKFSGITDYMSIDKYTDFMSQMDIAIFHNNRQQAMGNITLSSFLGCKVFISESTSMWEQYVIRGGCRFYPTEKIKDMSFSDFIRNNDQDLIRNKEYFLKVSDENTLSKKWSAVFNFA